MAYDKVVDSAVLDAGLKQIADAIREKGGTSDNLAFPTAMVDAIAAIEAGGGEINGARYVCGSFTPESDITSEFTVQHEELSMGDISIDVFFLWCSYDTMIMPDGSWGNSRFLWGAQNAYKHPTTGSERSFGVIAYTGSSGAFSATKYVFVSHDNQPAYSDSFTIKASSTYTLSAGTKYYWLRMTALS